MNKIKHAMFTEVVTTILKNRGLISEESAETRTAVHEIIREMDKLMYESLNRVVSWDVLNEIWRKYNSEGGWSMERLASHYGISVSTVQKIVHDTYW